MEEKNKAILFLAQQINQREALNAGYAMSTRWLVLRKDLQEKYLAEANGVVNEWWNGELEAKQQREAV